MPPALHLCRLTHLLRLLFAQSLLTLLLPVCCCRALCSRCSRPTLHVATLAPESHQPAPSPPLLPLHHAHSLSASGYKRADACVFPSPLAGPHPPNPSPFSPYLFSASRSARADACASSSAAVSDDLTSSRRTAAAASASAVGGVRASGQTGLKNGTSKTSSMGDMARCVCRVASWTSSILLLMRWVEDLWDGGLWLRESQRPGCSLHVLCTGPPHADTPDSHPHLPAAPAAPPRAACAPLPSNR
eukprot:357916-Chlamydomonas_euryale.AAC.14